MSHHPEQLAATLRRAVQDVLSRGLHDPRVRGLISVTSVTLSDDQRQVVVGVSVMPAEREQVTFKGLQHARAHVQSEVAGQLRLRRMPRLEFRLDRSLKKQAEVLAAIERSRRRDGRTSPTPPPPGPQ